MRFGNESAELFDLMTMSGVVHQVDTRPRTHVRCLV